MMLSLLPHDHSNYVTPFRPCRAVTPDNVAEYISRVADWRLNGELGRPMAAFVAGFTDLVGGLGGPGCVTGWCGASRVSI